MDNGRVKHNYVVLDEAQKRLKHGVIPNESWAFEAWCEHIERAYPDQDIVVGLEEGGGMSSPFDQIMQERGWSVRQLSPEGVRTYRETVLRVHNKTDDTDAFAMASMLVVSVSPHRELNQERAALRRATRWRDSLVAHKTELINQLRAVLALYWPETAGSDVFGEMSRDCLWVWILLATYPDPAVVVKTGAKRLLQFFRKQKSNVSAEKVEALVELARKNKAFADDKPFLVKEVAQLASLLREVDRCKTDTESAIKDMTQDDIDVKAIDDVYGVSVVQAASFMSEVRSFDRFQNERHMASYAGLALKRVQTGKSKDTKRPQQRANRRLRNCLLGIATSLTNNDERSKAYYQKKIKEGKDHRQALRALARHVLRRLYTILKRNHDQKLKEASPQEVLVAA
jgi:transposase